MKRCPQCEFIYEDDQALCDMDGALLVLDARTLPNLHALATVDVPVAPKAHWRHRTFPAMAALILATVLSLVYFVSTQRTAPVTAPIPASAPISSNAASTEANNNSTAARSSDVNQTPPAALELNGAAVTTKEDATPAKNETKPEPTKTNSTAASSTSSAAAKKVKPSATPERTPEEPKKDDSKVGSILKKTGRLLKKPFKL